MYIKNYSELTFTDDFIFCKVLSANKELCRELLELILGIKIRDISFVQEQKPIEQTYGGRGIRLDLYVESDEGTVYDVEMQTVIKRDLPKRMRYYQGMMDLNLIERGARYDELKPSYVIFICLDDPFDRGLPIYTFTERCREDETLGLADGTVKVLINAAGDRAGLSEEMADFLDYLLEHSPKGELTSRLQGEVVRAIDHKEWRMEYMTLQMLIQEERDEAREEERANTERERRRAENAIERAEKAEARVRELEAMLGAAAG